MRDARAFADSTSRLRSRVISRAIIAFSDMRFVSFVCCVSVIVKIACEREDSAFIRVAPTVRTELPCGGKSRVRE